MPESFLLNVLVCASLDLKSNRPRSHDLCSRRAILRFFLSGWLNLNLNLFRTNFSNPRLGSSVTASELESKRFCLEFFF